MIRKLAIVAALLLFGTAAHAACLADISSCPADPSWNGTFGYDDDYNGAGGSENACAARPEVWHQNCGPGTIVTEHYSQTFFYPPPGSDTTAPSQVSGLNTTVASSTEIDLSWTAATDDVGVTGYKVYRGGTLLTTLGNVTTYANTGLTPSTSYSYTVSALDAAGNEGTQSTASSKTTSAAPDTTAPTVPGGVSATAVSSTQINVAWTASTDNTAVTGYHVRRGGTVVATLGAVTTFNDTGRTPSTTYSYTVDAFDAAGNTSAQSTAASATTPAAPDTTAPSVPSGLSATAVSSTQINLAWTASTDNVAVTGYHVRRGGTVIATLGAVTTFQNTGLTASTTYSYTVDAFDAANNTSAQSTAASATTQAAGGTHPSDGFYIATNGSDSNAGTFAAPFLTFAKANTAMAPTGALKKTYVRAGTYSLGNTSGNCSTTAITLSTPNTTWQYDPVDGVNTAIINAGSTSGTTGPNTGICILGTGIILDGLKVQNSSHELIVVNATNVTVRNNWTNGCFNNQNSGSITFWGTVTGGQAYNNRITAGCNHGFQIGTNNGSGSISNLSIHHNYIYTDCTIQNDCGGVYIIDWATPRSTGVQVFNNYVYDMNNGRGIYLDDGTSNITITGNVVGGNLDTCFAIHGGINNVFRNNFCALNSTAEQIMVYQTTTVGGGSNMAGNVFQKNIIVAKFNSGAGAGYVGFGSPATPMAISNNSYWNYGTSGNLNHTGSGGAGSDASFVNQNPQLSGRGFILAAGSPVFSAPVSFPAQPSGWGTTGYWGPPGTVLLTTLTATPQP